MTTTQTNAVALLPCAHCGSDDIAEKHGDPVGLRWQYIQCNNCGASSIQSAHMYRAIAAWNRRATTPSPEAPAGEAVTPSLRLIGNQMSNVMFNLSQRAPGVFSDEEARSFAQLYRQWDDARIAAPVSQEAPSALPATPHEVIGFIGSHYEAMENENDPADIRYTLTVHDLLSAFGAWELFATPSQKEHP